MNDECLCSNCKECPCLKKIIEENNSIYKVIVDHYGKNRQIDKAIEELEELRDELIDYDEGDNLFSIADEIADVVNMVNELAMIFDIEKLVNERIKYKQKRTLDRIKMEREVLENDN